MLRLAALLLLLTASATAETVTCRFGTTGLTLGDLDVAYIDQSVTPPAALALSGVTLVEPSVGEYSLYGLPDGTPGGGESWYLRLTYGAESCFARWPTLANTPTSVVTTPLTVRLVGGAGEVPMVAGDTTPPREVEIYGFDASTIGTTATFELYAWDGTQLATAGSVTVTPAQTDDGSWMLGLRYDWAAADTASLAGTRAYGRFVITLPGGDVLTRPPLSSTSGGKELAVRIYN